MDETYVGGKPRIRNSSKRGRGTPKTPVFAAVERGGRIRRRVVHSAYRGLDKEFASHEHVAHGRREYARGDVNTNTAESSFALVKRGIIGVYHNVSKEYLHRYLWQFDFVWNTRKMNDGERTVAAIQSAEGKRLTYMASPNHA